MIYTKTSTSCESSLVFPNAFINENEEPSRFIDRCCKELHPPDKLGYELKNFSTKMQDKVNKSIKKELQSCVIENSIIKWFFNLELSNISGEEYERLLFEKLFKLFKKKSELSKFIILHSCDFLIDRRTGKQQEIDFLLFSSQRKVIIAIEVKKTVTRKAFEQLHTYQTIFEERLGDVLDNEWTFIPILFLGHETIKTVSNHIITPNTNLQSWIPEILEKYPVIDAPSIQVKAIDQLRETLKILVFIQHMKKNSCLKTSAASQDHSPSQNGFNTSQKPLKQFRQLITSYSIPRRNFQ